MANPNKEMLTSHLIISDGPMPDYLSSIQTSLAEGESRSISAQVHATISTYNSTAEKFRNDSSWWEQYIDFDPGIRVAQEYLYTNYSVGLLVNNFDAQRPGDKSWCFLGIIHTPIPGPNINDIFQYTALEFNTRRDLCNGVWTVTKDRVELVSGHCSPFSLPDSDQKIITNSTLAFESFYRPILADFLGSFSTKRNTSKWLIPTFTTTVAAMYWSRIATLYGYYHWGEDKSLNLSSDPYHWQRSQVYYSVTDSIISKRTTMDPSWILYLILAFQPFLAILFFFTALAFHQTPLDGGFSMIAVMAGVREESLKLLRGASLSGRLSRPVKMKIAISEAGTSSKGRALPQVEYILGGTGDNEMLEHMPRYRLLKFRNWLKGIFGRVLGREEGRYEMFSVEGESFHV